MTTFGFTRADAGRSLRQRVQHELIAAIVVGELEPGTVVSVPSLAAGFGVSATPVREAMLDLERLGFVQAVRNKGFRIVDASRGDLEHLVELRLLLEVPTVGALAGRLDAEQVRMLRELAARIAEAAEARDLVRFVLADIDFHRELIACAGNPRLTELVVTFRQQSRLTGIAGILDRPEFADSVREHERLVDLLEAGDQEGAETLMAEHIGHVLGWWAGRDEGLDGDRPAV